MKISKVKLIDSGLGGLYVEHETVTFKDGREYRKEHKDTVKVPVGAVLMNLFGELNNFCAEIVRIKAGPDLSVHQVTGGTESFLLTASVNSRIANKYYAVNTPLIKEDDGYENYDKVQTIVGKIWAATVEYMDLKDVRSDKQLVMEFNEQLVEKGKVDRITQEQLDGMSEEEIKKYATDFLEKKGSIVMHREDMGPADEGGDASKGKQEPAVRSIAPKSKENKEEEVDLPQSKAAGK